MRSALIVGAGIGGLAAAIALRHADWEVQIVEQAATPRELGFALALAPNALAALDELGLRHVVVPRGVEVKTLEVRRADGRLLKRIVMSGAAVQSVVLLRPALHGALLEAVGPGVLQPGCRVTGVESGSSAAVVTADNQDLSRRTPADVVVGADGVGSVVRRALHPGEPPPRPSGYHALRGVSENVADRMGGADAVVYLGDGVEIGVARASASAVYWYISLLDGAVEADAAAALDRGLRGVHETPAGIIRAAAADAIRLDRLWLRAPLVTWGRGRVTLLGDAAHPVLPHTAQGAAQALEDAVALGLALRGGDIEAGLRRYEQVRAARTRRIIQSGPRIAAMTTTRSRARIALRDSLVRLTPARVLATTMTRLAADPHRALRG